MLTGWNLVIAAEWHMKFAVFGAAGATGREIVMQAAARGHAVCAIDRQLPRNTFAGDVECHEADLLSGALEPAIARCDAVLNAAGLPLSLSTALAPPPLYTEGTIRLIHAMRQAGVSRLVAISASFVASRDRGPLWFRAAAGLALDRIFAQMAEMERLLAVAEDIDWTSVRPGWLMHGPLTNDYTVTPNVIPRGMLRTRHTDLARFMLDCAELGDWTKDTPAIARHEPAAAASPAAALQELLG